MKKTIFAFSPMFLGICLLLCAQSQLLSSQANLSKEETTLLKVAAGIHHIFENSHDQIWPGYDLSKHPYVVYLPGEWVLYLNAEQAPDNFSPYPEDWPDLGTRAFIHRGIYKDLAGQFEFDFQIGSDTTFAMGLPKQLLFSFDKPAFMLLSTTIHEGFHQYQRHHFGEIPWAREEIYPIQDTPNTALASLEMHILRDALRAMHENSREKVSELLKQFAAVRTHRWTISDPYIQKYEQGQEINEGTARFVEMKSMECALKLMNKETNAALLNDLRKDLKDLSIKELLEEDMKNRLTGDAVAPEDMLRNRIYPVGSTLGFLCDFLNIEWKMKFQGAGPEVSFSGLLLQHFGLDEAQLCSYLEKAKIDYGYESIHSASQNLIRDYLKSYDEALQKFNIQSGIEVEFSLSSNGLQRFRSSRAKKWVVDQGQVTLCLNYNLYSLKKGNVTLEVHNKGIFDQTDWEKKRKKVIFFADEISSVKVDGETVSEEKPMERNFNQIQIIGDDFKLEIKTQGHLSIQDNKITITI
ncbi:MAG: hypothetical protein GF421_00525 [Candidatus Aminicenantes bacterium]|nr:hypothetical protein [Candidatus Aminicenantes bacterium]